MKQVLTYTFSLLLFLSFSACNKDNTIEKENLHQPEISLGADGAKYTSKVGKSITITPTVKYATNAAYTWTMDGKVVSSTQSLTITFDHEGTYYLKFRVANEAGSDEEEILVNVSASTPPIISLNIPADGLKTLKNTDYKFTPTIQNADVNGFKCEWKVNNITVGNETTFTFHETETGTYAVQIIASNEDGEDSFQFSVSVLENFPYKVTFEKLSFYTEHTDRSTVVGRPIILNPVVENFTNPDYQWTVNGNILSEEISGTLKYVPSTAGDYTIQVMVSEKLSNKENTSNDIEQAETTVIESIVVHCFESEKRAMRIANASSSKVQNKVYEYVPAPGQFIGDTTLAGYTGNEKTLDDANSYAMSRLNETKYVSLGGFGGYIIVGFDHSIPLSGNEYDFTIQGNAYAYIGKEPDGNSEPGIVWVMQDVNGNGLPDDEWYELKGSETGKKETIQNYAVTYYRPNGIGMDVEWADSEGKKGTVNYNTYHKQSSYYPTWISESSYTLKGTKLKEKNYIYNNIYINPAYEWGYADNLGSDVLTGANSEDGSNQLNGFKIANAILSDGSTVNLQYIDFIKVQNGLNTNSGPLGEVSTEVFSFRDLSIN